MMTLGLTLRDIGKLPDSFFAFFYTGLGSALLLTGLLFLQFCLLLSFVL